MSGTVVAPQPAHASDLDAIDALRRSLEDWMAETGLVQWPRGSLPRERVAAQLARGEWWVVRDPEVGVSGSLRLLRTDPEFWGDDPTPAVHVHGLMVDRRRAGTGLGRALLDWSLERARAAGVDVLRLDCRTSNPALRAYYEGYGFTAVGVRDFATFSATLLQMPVRGAGVAAAG